MSSADSDSPSSDSNGIASGDVPAPPPDWRASEQPPPTPPFLRFLREPQPGTARCGHEDITFAATGQIATICHRCLQMLFFSYLQRGRTAVVEYARDEMQEFIERIAQEGEPALRHMPILDEMHQHCDNVPGRCTVHHPVNIAVGIMFRLSENLQGMLPWAIRVREAWEGWYGRDWNAENTWNETTWNVPDGEDIRATFDRFLNPISVVTNLESTDAKLLEDLEVLSVNAATTIGDLNQKVRRLENAAHDVEKRERALVEAARIECHLKVVDKDRKISDLETSVRNLSALLTQAEERATGHAESENSRTAARTIIEQQHRITELERRLMAANEQPPMSPIVGSLQEAAQKEAGRLPEHLVDEGKSRQELLAEIAMLRQNLRDLDNSTLQTLQADVSRLRNNRNVWKTRQQQDQARLENIVQEQRDILNMYRRKVAERHAAREAGRLNDPVIPDVPNPHTLVPSADILARYRAHPLSGLKMFQLDIEALGRNIRSISMRLQRYYIAGLQQAIAGYWLSSLEQDIKYLNFPPIDGFDWDAEVDSNPLPIQLAMQRQLNAITGLMQKYEERGGEKADDLVDEVTADFIDYVVAPLTAGEGEQQQGQEQGGAQGAT